LTREVFYFRSGAHLVYGSLYLPGEQARGYGIVICGSWGVEADRTQGMLRELALESAQLGVAAMLLHYPGQGDSPGTVQDRTLDELTRAAVDAAQEASRRRDVDWIFAGLRLGALVGARAAAQADAPRRLLLLEPALAPAAYFAGLEKAARRASLGVEQRDGLVFGYAVPPAIRDEARPLGGLAPLRPGDGAVVRYENTNLLHPVIRQLELIERPGRWRFQHASHPELLGAALGWLDRATGANG
jgi:hypothetical protein